MKGRWDLDKKPVVYEYRVDLRCGICDHTEVITFRQENAAQTPAAYPGDWRRFGFAGSHTDPLGSQSDVVVCSRDCAESFTRTYLDGLWA